MQRAPAETIWNFDRYARDSVELGYMHLWLHDWHLKMIFFKVSAAGSVGIGRDLSKVSDK